MKKEKENKHTTIRLEKGTHKRLMETGQKGQSFDDLINMLLDRYEEEVVNHE